jgi:very-short-patch-repair endonuclease
LGKVRLQRDVPQQVSTADFVIRPGTVEPVETQTGPAVPVDWAVIQTTLDHGIAHGAVAADAALRAGTLTVADVEGWSERVAGWPHSSRVSSLAHFVDALSESPGETLTRVHLQLAGLEVESQVRIIDPSTGEVFARVDFVVKGTKVAIEFDGQVKYTEGGSDALFAEKQREDRLRAQGYIVVRVVWSDLFVPGRLVARVRRAIAQAA